MATQHLFQLGMDLETGTTQTEEPEVHTAAVAADYSRNNGAESAQYEADNVVSLAERLADNDREDHFIRKDGKIYAGTHLIIEVVGGTGLDCVDRMEAAFRRCVEECKATLLHIHLHKFSPQGVSGVAVLAESHISVHTWPEAGYGAFDVFMCGDSDPWKAVDILREAFNADDVRVDELLRGDGVV